MRIRDIINIIESAEKHPSPEFIQCLEDHMSSETNYHIIDDQETAEIQKVFDREMPKLNQSKIVYRGWCLDDENRIKPKHDFFKHDMVKFDYYLSTSEDKMIAEEFAWMCADHDFKKNVIVIMFKITLKAGTRAIVVPDYARYIGPDNQHKVKFEKEIILNRNSQFRVIHRNKTKCPFADNFEMIDAAGIEYWEIELEQIA